LRQGSREFVFPLGNGRRNPPQHALTLECGEATRGSESLDGGCNGSFGVLAPSLNDPPNYAAIVGRSNLDDVPVFDPRPSTKKPCAATGVIVISAMMGVRDLRAKRNKRL